MITTFSRKWQLRLLAALAVFAVALSPTFAQHALAHPLGNFTTNRYARIELYQDRAHIHYVVDLAEIPTFQALPSIDTDGNGAASEVELSAFAERSAMSYAENFELRANGQVVAATPIEHTAQLLPGQGGLDVLRVVVVYDAPIRATAGESVSLAFEDDNFSGTQGWKEIVVRPSEGASVEAPPALFADMSNALLEYPAESLRSAPNVSQAQFSWVAGSGSAAPANFNLQLASEGRADSGFSGIFADLTDGNATVGFLLLSLLIAFAFGAQHALGPGHGKTMVAGYLVGSRGTPKHAVVLGLTVTATHTSTVYLLGIVTLVAAAWITPETVYVWMGVAAGVMVIGFGLALFVQRALSYRRTRVETGVHRHGIFGKAHTHAHEHTHDEEHTNDEDVHRHVGHAAAADHGRVTWRSLLSLGVLGGLLPCPSAVVVMVAAISQGQVLLGMLLIVAFSLGLAGVLIAIGISLVLGRRIPARQRRFLQAPAVSRLVAVMPVLSAVVVTVVGLGLTYQAFGRV